MNANTIDARKIHDAFRTAYSRLDFMQFCQLLDFEEDDYGMQKFDEFKKGVELLCGFDSVRFEKLLNL